MRHHLTVRKYNIIRGVSFEDRARCLVCARPQGSKAVHGLSTRGPSSASPPRLRTTSIAGAPPVDWSRSMPAVRALLHTAWVSSRRRGGNRSCPLPSGDVVAAFVRQPAHLLRIDRRDHAVACNRRRPRGRRCQPAPRAGACRRRRTGRSNRSPPTVYYTPLNQPVENQKLKTRRSAHG